MKFKSQYNNLSAGNMLGTVCTIAAILSRRHCIKSQVGLDQYQLISISGAFSQKQVSKAGRSNYTPQVLCDVITCSCPWYLVRTQHTQFIDKKLCDKTDVIVNLSPRSAAYMCQWIGSALVQIMACRQLDAEPLFEPVLACCQLDYQEQTSVKL